MLFNSLSFIIGFFPSVIFVYYWLIRLRLITGAKIWLIIASCYFYSFGYIYYLPLLLFSMCFNFSIGTILSKKNCHLNKKAFLIFGIIANILLLAYFKYTNFIIDNLNVLYGLTIKNQNIALPLAISFFTFQQIGYLCDSYKGLTKKYDFLNYSLFVTFFPQLIAGPIVAHYEIIPQFTNTRNWIKNYRHIFMGLCLFLIGLFKKVIIADYFANYASLGFDKISNLTMIGGWFTSLSYTIQIYFDFSGYCDMAMGLAKMFNITLPINFNSPYKALNIQDFWRRWHITLSRFLRDYLYIPLGGNRKGYLRSLANVFLVFLIGGLWHGAAWTFVVWGALHGLANIFWRLWHKTGKSLNKWIAWFITFNFINITWIFFRAKSFNDAIKVIKAMFNFNSLKNLPAFSAKYYLNGFNTHSDSLIKLIIVLVFCLVLPNSLSIIKKIRINSTKQSVLWGLVTALTLLILLVKIIIIPYTEFIYFNF